MKKYTSILLFTILLFSSCGDYYKILKSTDYEVKWEAAKRYYEQKKFSYSYTLLEELVTVFKGTDKAEECMYLLGQSYFGAKDYTTSSQYFQQYYNTYPKGEYAELARFYCGYGYYLESPEFQLDQTDTNKAIREFQLFMEYYPRSEKITEVQALMSKLQDKLVLKTYKNAELYYYLGNYMGNNYQACVITAQNALREYPNTTLKEDLHILVLRAKYQEAAKSYVHLQPERFRAVIDEFYNYRNEFPQGKYMKEAQRYYEIAQRSTRADAEGIIDLDATKAIKKEKRKKEKKEKVQQETK